MFLITFLASHSGGMKVRIGYRGVLKDVDWGWISDVRAVGYVGPIKDSLIPSLIAYLNETGNPVVIHDLNSVMKVGDVPTAYAGVDIRVDIFDRPEIFYHSMKAVSSYIGIKIPYYDILVLQAIDEFKRNEEGGVDTF